ncbi:SPARC-like protein 1 [Thalassophryne amazonica]|uniref:SPARC-like protein 1 n=1 Tax=Thalassophryne amazonica TaxID=390379 RepID=UPI00147111B9|nr:SPARC-like protein 1 [Thalassophryne amazonica]
MKICLVFICLFAVTFSLSVKSKHGGKHHASPKNLHPVKEKDIITEEADDAQVIPSIFPFEASSLENKDEEMQQEDNANANKEDRKVMVVEKSDTNTAILLSEEELMDLLKKEQEDEVKLDKGKDEEDEMDNVFETAENIEETTDKDQESKEDAQVMKKEDEEKARKSVGTVMEELEGSTGTENLVDLDYAADSGVLQYLQIRTTTTKPKTDTNLLLSKVSHEEIQEKENLDDNKGEKQNTKTEESDEDMDKKELQEDDKDSEDSHDSEISASREEPKDSQDPDISVETEMWSRLKVNRGEEEKNKNDSGRVTKGKTKKHKKKQRLRKHSPQRDETLLELSPQESDDSSTDSTGNKIKRRRAGKWGPLVGMNPVQIRAAVDLYLSSWPSRFGNVPHPESSADSCDSFHCKRGKTCKLDTDNKPRCVCQEPSECPHSVNGFDHVCGTDNHTYDTSCELFATKCKLEGTKQGHRLHLDYTGSCKLIPACVDNELVQFPLRMRDWLKNVLLQLYDHDSTSTAFLTPKQRFRVKKIYESERRLHAGDHAVKLLVQDFEKNYNMYIYPVHWQFAQLDQHPSDRFLSHSELAPLRVPLVPMEHCTSRFFQECDADKDKQVSFKEWTSCFGIKDEDTDVKLLF